MSYTENQMNFLEKKIKEMLVIANELENEFGRPFTLDGHMLGSIGELYASYYYGIKLHKPSAETHDGIALDGRSVQIKITQGNSFSFRKEPEYLIALHLDTQTGEITEVYNGNGRGILDGSSSNRVGISKLVELTKNVPEHECIPAIQPVKKYERKIHANNVNGRKIHKSESGKTLVNGYVNRNQQMNCGCTGEEGNLPGQIYYWMKCLHCGHEYKANGCDVWLRKCPDCMKG